MRDLSGVRQDHRGKLYREVEVINRITGRAEVIRLDTIQPNGTTPPARMIPEPLLAAPAPKRKQITTTNSKGEKEAVRFVPKRLHVVELRRRGQAKIIKEVAENGSNGLAALIDSNLCRYDGKEWHPLFPSIDDFHVQYHLDSKEPA